jgi:WD40 repeat protein
LAFITKTCDHSDNVNYLLQINETTIVSAGLKGDIKIFRINNNDFEMIREIKNECYVFSMIKINENTIAYSTCDEEDFIFAVVDINTAKYFTYTRTYGLGKITALLKFDGYLITGLSNGKSELWDMDADYNYLSETVDDEVCNVYGDDFLMSIVKVNKNLFATGLSNGKIKIYQVLYKDMILIRILDSHHSSVNCLIMLKDGRLVSGSSDSSVIVWGLKFELESVLRTDCCKSITQVIQLKDGRIASLRDGKIVIWS